MLLKLLRYCFGYVKVTVYGFAPERFMNLIIKNDIIIWNVETIEQGFSFYTGRRNLLDMKPYLKKTNMKIQIMEKHGLPYFLKSHRKRTPFLVGFILFGVFLYIVSQFVWEIKVTGEDTLVAENLLKQIEEKYIPLGTLKSNVDCAKLEESLRRDFDEISWISCELKGTVLTIHLEEGMLIGEKEDLKITGDIVASKDATITKIITRQGTPVAKVRDKVKKGEILISGTIYIYDDNNEVMETDYIKADGDVYGTTRQSYEDYIDLKYYKKQYEEKGKTYITFYFMNYCFTPFIPKVESENVDTCTQVHKARIFSNFYLPFGYKTVRCTEYSLQQKQYSDKVAKKILEERLDKKIMYFEQKGVEIIENNVTIEKVDGQMRATGHLILNEPVAMFKKTSGNIPMGETDR